jgi:DNA repair exonuclease SbcCD nuclease subunit
LITKASFLVFSDPHLHAFKEFSYEIEGENSRRKRILDRIKGVLGEASGSGRVILFGGDMFHDRTRLDVESAVPLLRIFSTELTTPFVGSSGTHDLTHLGISSLEILSAGNDVRIDGVYEHDECIFICVGDVQTLNSFDLRRNYVEHLVEKAKEEFGDRVYQSRIKVFIGHGVPEEPEFGIPFGHANGWKVRWLEEMFDFVVLGHYHLPVAPRSPFLRTLVPGTLIPHSFADSDAGGGSYWLVDLEKDGENVNCSVQRKEYPSPRFMTLIDDGRPSFKEEIDRLSEAGHYICVMTPNPLFSGPFGNNVRLRFLPHLPSFTNFDGRQSDLRQDALLEAFIVGKLGEVMAIDPSGDSTFRRLGNGFVGGHFEQLVEEIKTLIQRTARNES